MFPRLIKGKKITATTPKEESDTTNDQTVTITANEWTTLTELLGLEAVTSVSEVLAVLAELVEEDSDAETASANENKRTEEQKTTAAWSTVKAQISRSQSTTDDVTTVAKVYAAQGIDTSQGVRISAKTWAEMQPLLATGYRASQQQQRKYAETVIDEAIKYQRVRASQREHWINTFCNDPDGTLKTINSTHDYANPPRAIEIGHGLSIEGEASSLADKWVV